jgi:hypothetical protein
MSRQTKIAHASIRPVKTLDLLSQREMASLANADAALHELFRRCALAILNTDGYVDDARKVYEAYADFDVRVVPESRGLKLELVNAPSEAFVDGKMIEGIRNHLFSALRDIVFTEYKLAEAQSFDPVHQCRDHRRGVSHPAQRQRGAQQRAARLVVCWGGHSISRAEYDYSKTVGYSWGCAATTSAPAADPAP